MLSPALQFRGDDAHRAEISATSYAAKQAGAGEARAPLLEEARELASIPSDVRWQRALRARLGPESRRAAFLDFRVDRVDEEGPRATVRGRLADGTPQSMRLVRTTEGWFLEEFEPYR
jgi:hypothetical protein